MVFGFGWTPHFTRAQIPSLQGKVAVVTGGNSGLGLETSRQLALFGAKVFIGVRKYDRGQEAKRIIEADLADAAQTRYPGGSVELLPKDFSLDLSDLKKVATWSDSLLSATQRLDILVCAAGVIHDRFERAQCPQHELTYVTCHLGHFFLVAKLWPLLKATANPAIPGDSVPADVRVVLVSADVTRHVDTLRMAGNAAWLVDESSINNERKWSRMGAYMRSKMCNVLFARRLAQLQPVESDSVQGGVRVNSLHAGVFYSNIGFSRSPDDPEPGLLERLSRRCWKFIVWCIAMNTEQSALTTLYAATSDEIRERKYHGQFFLPYGIMATDSLASLCKDDEVAKKLWSNSIRQVKEALHDGTEEVQLFDGLGQ